MNTTNENLSGNAGRASSPTGSLTSSTGLGTEARHGEPASSFGKAADELKSQIGDALDRGRSGVTESAYAARDNLGEDMARLREDMARMTQTLGKFASETGGEAAKTARSVGAAVASQVGSAASGVAEAGADVMTAASERAKTFASELEGMARRQPLGALAGALVVGVLVGMMSRGRG